MLLGLTGGVACGKSLAARFFGEEGWNVVDTDKLAQQILLEDEEVKQSLVERWGTDVIRDGSLDRSRVGAIVFSEGKELSYLENLLHPRVLRSWQELVANGPDQRWVVEVPLLFEADWGKYFPYTLAVGASLEIIRRRLKERPGDFRLWEKRMARQWPVERKMETANFVLWNNGEPVFLQKQIRFLLAQPCFLN